MTEKKVPSLALKDLFSSQTYETPDLWDVGWINSIRLPEDISLNPSQAIKAMTDTARAIEWCGEKLALIIGLVSRAEDDYKEEWSQAFLMRSRASAANQKTVEADADPAYLKKKALYNRMKSYYEFFKQKQNAFTTIHHAMKEIVKMSHNEFGVANWGTTADAYEKK